ncbi:hypothetical protein EVAR_65331_1 [Eumeta japonica]|uniref:Uncharacterized protein n=1 Tax=Eumeta variegata TaxID=151549 RepID=A0A4C1YQT9_EUMVA|nr:hypothetical protein EVAR_65331_1 [Eumeta japonica]
MASTYPYQVDQSEEERTRNLRVALAQFHHSVAIINPHTIVCCSWLAASGLRDAVAVGALIAASAPAAVETVYKTHMSPRARAGRQIDNLISAREGPAARSPTPARAPGGALSEAPPRGISGSPPGISPVKELWRSVYL